MSAATEELADLPVKRPIDREPTHPGVLLREILVDRVQLSVAEAAVRMGVTRQSLHAVLSGRRAVNADIALRFGRLVGADPSLYLAMQHVRDLWLADRSLASALAAIKPVA